MWELIYPSLILLGGVLLVLIVLILVAREVRRSPKAQAAAETARVAAGQALLELDTAIEEADIELGLASAVYGGGAPASLARARLLAIGVRDESFEQFRVLTDLSLPVPQARQIAARIRTRVTAAIGELRAANAEHSAWLRSNADAPVHVTAARARLSELRQDIGDPQARGAEVAARFDTDEIADVVTPLLRAQAAADLADSAIERAAGVAGDPTQSALADLTEAERRLREGEREAAAADQAYEQLLRAAGAVQSELADVRSTARAAIGLLGDLPPDAAGAASASVHEAQARLDALDETAQRRPLSTIREITRVRDRLDLAVGDARSARARIDGAKAALPGTFATARTLIARADAALQEIPSAEARVRLAAARDEMAAARNASDVVEALDSARRAIRHAEDADALVSYERAHRP